MKASLGLPLLVLAGATAVRAQVSDPHITSWLTANSAKYARVYETSADKTSGNAVATWPRSGLTNGGGGQATAAYSDVQRVVYSTNYVYIYATGLPSYTMGYWLTPTGQTYTSWPTNRGAIHRIPRNPSIPTTKQKNNGSGGVLVELFGDAVCRLCPLTDRDAADMLNEIRGIPRLRGHRGRPVADEAALRDALVRVSVLLDRCPEIQELDINPINVLTRGTSALDVRVRVAEPAARPSARRVRY